MVESATQFAKSGFNEADAAQLAKVSSMYQNIADEQLSAGEASEFIISQMKAFNITADKSSHIIDSVNNVSNHMSVSSADLARNLGNMSAAMSVGGNTMEESIGLLTGITEITRSAASASRALVTIQSRFNQIVDESSSTGKNLLKWYTEHGIAVKDDAGQLRSLYDVMSDLAPMWDSLSKNEQSYFMQQQAGARQSQNVAALLSNFNSVQKATELAYNSSGSAAAENAKVLEGLEAKTADLKATWQDFANKTIDSELVKSLLNLANGALKILNTGVGRTITRFTLLSGVFVGLGGVIAQVVPAIIAAFKGIKISAVGATAAMQGFKASIPVVGVVLAALSTIIIGITSALKNQNAAIEEIRQSIDSANDAYDDAVATANANEMQAQSLIGTIETLNKVIKLSDEQQYIYKEAVNKLNELYPDLNLNIDKHTGKIKEDTGAIRDRIAAMKEEALYVALQEKRTATYKTIADAQVEQYKVANELRADLQEAKKKIKDNPDLYSAQSKDVVDLVDQDISALTYEDLISFYDQLTQGMIGYVDVKPLDEYTTKWDKFGKIISDANGDLEALDGIQQSLAATIVQLKTNTEENSNAEEVQLDNVDDLKKAYDALSQATKDYITYGGLQSETQEALDEALPGLNELLYDEAGALTEDGKAALRGSKELARFVLTQKQEELQAQKTALAQAEANEAEARRFRTRQSLMGQTLLLLAAEEEEAEAARQAADAKKNIENIKNEIAWLEQLLAAFDASASNASSTTDAYKKEFTDWLAYKDHQLAMDEITEEQYYAELSEMVDKFFKGKSQYQEEYWQYSEKIYAYEKKRMQELVEESTKAIEESTKAVEDAVDKINEKYDSELSRLEEVNDALSDQIEYEKLLDEMAKAREQKKLVYKDGRFQYVQDADAISAAQAKLDEYNRNKALEASKADIEARRKAEVRQTVLAKMQANSAAWATSTSPAEREALHNANVELAKLLEDNATYNAATGKWSSYAGGTLGATGGISLVGENGPEMRILNRGDGILTSGVTKNLFAWGSTSPSDFVSALKGLIGFKFGNSSNTTVNVNNLELPNVTNAREFVTGLKNLALQYAYERG